MKPFSQYIDFDLKHKGLFFYIALFLLVCSHLLHYAGKNLSYIIFFKCLFVISYLAFIISDLLTLGRIHIANLIGRFLIILLVAVSIYTDIQDPSNVRSCD